MEINVNMSGVQDGSTLLDPGTYAIQCKKVNPRKIDGTKFYDLFTNWEVTDGEFAGKQILILLTTDDTIIESTGSSKNFQLFNVLKALGEVDSPKDLENYTLDTDVFVNKELEVVIEHTKPKKEGDTIYHKYSKFLPPS